MGINYFIPHPLEPLPAGIVIHKTDDVIRWVLDCEVAGQWPHLEVRVATDDGVRGA